MARFTLFEVNFTLSVEGGTFFAFSVEDFALSVGGNFFFVCWWNSLPCLLVDIFSLSVGGTSYLVLVPA